MRSARRSPDGVFWRQEMQSGVPTALFGVRKCNPESRRHFLASGNAIRGPDGTFWRQEMRSGVPTALFGVSERQKKCQWVKVFQRTNILSLCVPHYCSAPFGGWAAGLDNKVSYLIYALSSGIVSFVQLGHKFCHASHSCHLAFTHFIRSTQQGSLSFRTRQKTLVFDVQFDLRHSI